MRANRVQSPPCTATAANTRQLRNARGLRRDASPPERVLWSHLRGGRLGGLKFRRQYPVGPYVCDFFCSAANLVVEIDGRVHESRAERDRARDDHLAAQDLRVLRISASDISKDLNAVLEMILREVRKER